jgi:hypothetical protein
MQKLQTSTYVRIRSMIFSIMNKQSLYAGKLLVTFMCALFSFNVAAQVDNSLQDYFKQNLFCVHNGLKGGRFVFNEECLDTLVNRVDSIVKFGSGNSYDFKSYDQNSHLIGSGSFHLHPPLGTQFEKGEGEELVRRPNFNTVVCVTSLEYFHPFNCLQERWLKRCGYNWFIPSRSYWGANGCTYTSEEIKRMPGR